VAVGQLWAFTGGAVSITLPGGEVWLATCRLGLPASPRNIDLAFRSGPWKGVTLPGICEAGRGTLRVRYSKGSGGRPAAFKSEGEGRGTVLLEMEHVTPAGL